ncbi:hypothetical protein F5878DRAFT_545508, partial [Lentinula raphanica]
LVYKASGQFIFASTVVKFVNDELSLPWERLRIVLGSADSHDAEDTERPFGELDRLYQEILSVNRKAGLLCRILGAIVISPEKRVPTTVMIEQLLGLEPGTVSAALWGMHSVLKASPNEVQGKIVFAHKSFTDFLLDRDRSGKFFIDRQSHHNFMACRCLKLMLDWQTGIRPEELEYYRFPDWIERRSRDEDVNEHWPHHRDWGYHCVSASASPELFCALRALDPVAYANRLLRVLSKSNHFGDCSALLGFFMGKMRDVQRWAEVSETQSCFQSITILT